MPDVSISVVGVTDVAGVIEKHKGLLEYQLNRTKEAVSGLSGSWKTPASDMGRNNYALYAAKNFSSFCEGVQGYANFLHLQVGDGYTATENSNADLAQLYK